jgi:urease accessory protein
MTALLDILLKPILHEGGGSTAISGFLHPLLGFDHLLAMVTVGLLSAQMGGRAIWTVPATFVGVMALAGIAGYAGAPLPFVEIGITLSVVVLGVALLIKRKFPEAVAMAFVGLFSIFHGHAHGAELGTVNTTMDVVAYVLGFMTATAGLHVIGALIGYLLIRNERGEQVLRYSGAVIAAIGVFLFMRVVLNA